VQRALDCLTIKTQELIWHPFKWCASMWATIDVTKKMSLLINDEYFLISAGYVSGKATRRFLLYIISMAELDMMLVSHGLKGGVRALH
jgi:hypothetical protein